MEKTGHPAPSLSLSMNKSSDMAKLGGGSRARVNYYPTIEETGSVFICKWEQVGPGGEILYQGEEVSAPLDVMMVPSILADTPAEYEYQDRMQLLVFFLAKPAPAQEDVQWNVVMDNQVRLGVEVVGELVGGEVNEVSNTSYKFETAITISNLTENMTLEITIRNMAGSVKKMFFIMVPSPNTPNILPSPTMEQFQATSSTTVMDMTATSIVGLIALFLFTIFLVLIIIILLRFRRKEQEQKTIVKGWSKNINCSHILCHLDEYRRVPLISVDPSLPRNICCHSLDSSCKTCSCQRNIQGISMKTFGQDTQQDNTQGCRRSGKNFCLII